MIKIFETKDEASQAMAEKFETIAKEAVANNGQFTFALAGGSSLQKLYDILRSDTFQKDFPWEKCFVFWGDERVVPYDSEFSNTRMGYEKLLNHVAIPESQIFRVNGEVTSEESADDYEAKLKEHFGDQKPIFDLILLGMGADGHTASIFPGSEAVHEKNRLITTGYNSEQGTHRISFTAPLINKAKYIFFGVFGAGKANTLKQVFEGDYNPDELPVQLIKSETGETIWYLDKSSAKLIKGTTK